MSSKKYLSGAAKRKKRKNQLQEEAKGRQTLGWSTCHENRMDEVSEDIDQPDQEYDMVEITPEVDHGTHDSSRMDEISANQPDHENFMVEITPEVDGSSSMDEDSGQPDHLPSSDPGTWAVLTAADRDLIVARGPQPNPL